MGLKSRYPVPFLMGQNPKQYKMWWMKVIDLKLTYLIGLLSSVIFCLCRLIKLYRTRGLNPRVRPKG